jgi:NAD(P)-dependent dehydrogenase (short-subunit alcohol dehydrogenase family)
LGFEFARQYAVAGWHVFAACRNPAGAHQLQQLAQDNSDTLILLPIDVTDWAMVQGAALQLRGTAIDVLINNAGIAGPSGQGSGHIDYAAWHNALDVNTMGPMRMLESFTEHLAASARRLVVTITSGMGSIFDNTSGGHIPYRTSKAAVNMAMRSAAIDLARRRITCVVVNPGWVRTDMGGLSARLTPEQSVTALRRLIETLGPEHSGKFYNYDGREYPW